MATFGACKSTKEPCKCEKPEYSIGGMCFNCKKTKRVISDSERLEFLIELMEGVQIYKGNFGYYRFKNYKTPREAIDAAMKEST